MCVGFEQQSSHVEFLFMSAVTINVRQRQKNEESMFSRRKDLFAIFSQCLYLSLFLMTSYDFPKVQP